MVVFRFVEKICQFFLSNQKNVVDFLKIWILKMLEATLQLPVGYNKI